MEYGMGEKTARNAVTVGTQTDEIIWRLEDRGKQPTARMTVCTETDETIWRLEDPGKQPTARMTLGTQTDETIWTLEDRGKQPTARITVGTQTDETIWRLEELDEQPRARKPVTVVSTQTTESFLRLQDQDGLLLPGLLDEITLGKIVPKLPWRALHVLSSVSRPWQQAIRNHQVHDARVRSHSTETLVILSSGRHHLSLYSARDGGYHRLPGIPHLETGGFTSECRFTSLDGKIYVFGGFYKGQVLRAMEVWVLDLAGQRQWKQCASMEKPKYNFRLGVLGGKIYLFGGVCNEGVLRDSEVYDPKENSWSQIAPMLSWRELFTVTILGEELFLHGGYLSSRYEFPEGIDNRGLRPGLRTKSAMFSEVYHTVKDEWRLLQPFGGTSSNTLFLAAQGKLHKVTGRGTYSRIDVYDLEENTWSHLHSLSFDDILSFEEYSFHFDNILAVDDELLVIGHATGSARGPTIFLRSKGFGSNAATLSWERLLWGSFDSPPYTRSLEVCTIQL